MLETAGRLLTIVVLATAIALAPQEIQAQSGSKPTAPDAPPVGAPAGVTCQGNTIYIVCVNTATSSALGRYTARTASGHPSPGQNLLFGGARESPGTTFNSYRSFTSGTTYTQGSVSGAINLDTVTPTFSLIGTTGVRTTWNVTTPDRLRIVQDVNVVGSTLTDVLVYRILVAGWRARTS